MTAWFFRTHKEVEMVVYYKNSVQQSRSNKRANPMSNKIYTATNLASSSFINCPIFALTGTNGKRSLL